MFYRHSELVERFCAVLCIPFCFLPYCGLRRHPCDLFFKTSFWGQEDGPICSLKKPTKVPTRLTKAMVAQLTTLPLALINELDELYIFVKIFIIIMVTAAQ